MHDRQNHLKTQYGFTCGCILCRVERDYPVSFQVVGNKTEDTNFEKLGTEILSFFREKSPSKFCQNFDILANKLSLAHEALSEKFLRGYISLCL